jgi:3-deoxy-D-manno-octulosonic acid kinase
MRPNRPARSAARPRPQRYALPGNEFKHLTLGRRTLYLRDDLLAQAGALVTAFSHPPLRKPGGDALGGAGNRGSGFPLNLDNCGELFIRYARRGGLMRFLISDLYCGFTPRPVHELAVTAEARRRGVPVAKPLGAIVQWIAPTLYRGAFLTRMLHGMTLWQFMQTDDDPMVRMHVAEQARRAINVAHRQGLFHADLNLHNIFVTTAGESFAVVLLDLDKARICPSPLAPALAAKNLARLRRSIGKLDPASRYFNRATISALTDS